MTAQAKVVARNEGDLTKINTAIRNMQNQWDTAASWTPAVEFGGASTGITYGTQVGRVISIGTVHHVFATVALTSKGSATGSMTITGLPTTSATATGLNFVGMFTLLTDMIKFNDGEMVAVLPNNSSTISVYDFDGTTDDDHEVVTDGWINDTTGFSLQLTYYS